MEAQDFYRPLPDKLCQGDVFERIPLIHLKEPPVVLNKTTLAGNRMAYEIGEVLSPTTPPGQTANLLVHAACDYTRALLLTYDCEIDKPIAKHLTLALIRPLEALPDPQKEINRGNRTFSFFHLPADGISLAEGYVDFRRLTVISPAMIQSAKRIAALAEPAWKAMLFQFIRYWTRLEMNLENLSRTNE